MVKIGLHDEEFRHLSNYCGYDAPEEMEWAKDSYDQDILVFTERCYERVLNPLCKGKIKIAWPLEPRAIHGYAYENLCSGLHSSFDYVLTFDLEFTNWLHANSKAKPLFWTPGGSWILLRDWKIYPKTKNVSIVAGMKTWTVGHRLRQEVIKRFPSQFDLVCGYGRAPVEPKSEIFKDFRYSVVIENSKVDYYWTDKLIDCFACGTVPIFWGCPSIEKFFDPAGIIKFDNLDELNDILKSLGPEDYERRKGAIMNNFECAKRFVPVEKYMFHWALKPIIESR